MHPSKVSRERLSQLTDLPNVGPAVAADLRLLGIDSANQLIGKDPIDLYDKLCEITSLRHDPCMIDVFMSICSFMNGAPPKPWWDFTDERKRMRSGTSHASRPR